MIFVRKTCLLLIISATLSMPFFVEAAEIRQITFPVAGEYSFTDSFGDPRSDGRTHLGTDIMAEKMTPVVSAVDGYVSYLTVTEPYWGYAIYIKDSDNYEYRYLHINDDTPGTDDGNGGIQYAFAPTIKRGVNVSAGQLIGWVGDSGNAENAGSHLHFEIWTPSRSVINSYPSLMAATHTPIINISFVFSKDLSLGSKGQEVYELQKYLNHNGFIVATTGAGSMGNETTYFGPATQAALIKFQKAKNISPAVGYFGPITRSFINSSYVVPSETITTLQPGLLVKNKKTVEVFYVDENMELRWIINEQVAEKHFGPTWNQIIKEVDDINEFGLAYGPNLQ
ncbi:peptidoglycan DD-metalloendopeptidase family protein [Patescibacteria group bacterium]|nr:peptidoglycan DD-metalloendopeptidase family protein [Patescibacteria group bacterium]